MLRHPGGRPPDPRRVRLTTLTGIVVLTVVVPLAVASAGPTDGRTPASVSARASAPAPAPAAPAHSSVANAPDGPNASNAPTGPDGPDGPDGPYADVLGDTAARAAGRRASTDGTSASGEGSGSGGPVGSGGAHADGRAPGPAPVGSAGPLTLGVGLATAVRCGPELASPEGIEAQTCVLTQGRETWARTYYRNATGDALTSALALMGPDGGTVRTHCAVDADDEPGLCETPRERTSGEASAYLAVAEFAADADGPLLLRSGSNSPTQKGR